MRGQRDGRKRAQLLGHIRPGGVQQRLLSAAAFGDRLEQTTLAVEAVLDVFADALVRGPDRWTVARAENLESALSQSPQAIQITGERPGSGATNTLPSPSIASPAKQAIPAIRAK